MERVPKPRQRVAWRPARIELLYSFAGLGLVLHYAWLLDDAFVYFRYIDNLLFLHLGLVYNAGEYVEGFSSPFWTLLLIPLRATGIDYWLLVRALAGGAFLAFALLLVRLNRDFLGAAKHGAQTPTLNFPLAFLALNYGVASYFSSGVESPLIVLLAACYALFVMRPGSAALQAVVGLSPLVRPELLLPLGVALAWSWWRERRIPWLAVAVAGAANGAWLLFRVGYYADLLPNTFYLKDTADFAQGWAYLKNTAGPYHLLPILLLAGAALVGLRHADRSEAERSEMLLPQRLAMLAIALPVLLYVVRIGGDPRHFRYLIFPFCLVVCALGGIPELLLRRFAHAGRARITAVAGVAVALFSASLYPPQLSGHPAFPGREHESVDKINDAYGHRMAIHHADWGPPTRIERQRSFLVDDQPIVYDGIIDTWICMASYVQFDKRVINNLGLTDPILARTNMKADRPAHKFGLYPLAEDLRRVQEQVEPGRGMYRQAVESGIAPDWIVRNLESIEVIEAKVYNRHDFGENLRLAFQFPKRIEP